MFFRDHWLTSDHLPSAGSFSSLWVSVSPYGKGRSWWLWCAILPPPKDVFSGQSDGDMYGKLFFHSELDPSGGPSV